MDLDQMIREGKEMRAKQLERRAKAIHEASTEHVRAQLNELHHVIALAIAPELIEADHDLLEREVREAINRARDEVDKHTNTDPVRRAAELMMSGDG
jgi:DNA-binding protein YbaB